MKVKDLIEQLKDLDPEMEVIMSKDGEGNGFSPLSDIDANSIYIAETTWYGDVYDADWSAEDAGFNDDEETEAEWEQLKQGPKSVVLWPTN